MVRSPRASTRKVLTMSFSQFARQRIPVSFFYNFLLSSKPLHTDSVQVKFADAVSQRTNFIFPSNGLNMIVFWRQLMIKFRLKLRCTRDDV